jgi:hypothetical protein
MRNRFADSASKYGVEVATVDDNAGGCIHFFMRRVVHMSPAGRLGRPYLSQLLANQQDRPMTQLNIVEC